MEVFSFFFARDCTSPFTLTAPCLAVQIKFHLLLSDRLVLFSNNCNTFDNITSGAVCSSRGVQARLRPESCNLCRVVLACPEHQGASPAPIVRMRWFLLHRWAAHLSETALWSSQAFLFVCLCVPLYDVRVSWT